MSMTSPDRIEMSQAQRQRLRHLIRAGTTAQQLARRARIVLLAAAGWTNTTIAQRVGVCGHRSQVAAPLVGAAGHGIARRCEEVGSAAVLHPGSGR